MRTKPVQTEERRRLLEEQINAVERLIAEYLTVEAAAASVGVSTDSLTLWRSGKTLARGLIRRKLLAAAVAMTKNANRLQPERGGVFPRFDIEPEKREKLEIQLRKLRLAPPPVRADNLRNLLNRSRLSITTLAREIGIHENTLKDYLNPQYTRLMSLKTAGKIEAFRQKLEGGGVAPISLEERLKKALEILLGKKIVAEGFYERDLRRTRAAEKLSAATGLSSRAIRRYFPPFEFAERRLPEYVVEALEQAAAEHGDLLSSPDFSG